MRTYPDYIPIYVQRYMNVDTRAHENEDPIRVLLPTLDYLVVFLCDIRVYGEERT
jgi:hypothetical protein